MSTKILETTIVSLGIYYLQDMKLKGIIKSFWVEVIRQATAVKQI
jgi:hypothetical protein